MKKIFFKVFIILLFFFITGCYLNYHYSKPNQINNIIFYKDAADKPLINRTIVLDAGHGGSKSGAVGKNGLKESEINLSVILYLKSMLESAGANVITTRETDIDVSLDTSTSVRKELRSRVKKIKNIDYGLFISVHHNSNTNNRRKNDLKIFYKYSALPGPEPFLSGLIAEELNTFFNYYKTKKIIPANYYILRKLSSPALLLELSYISNPKVEKGLKQITISKKEAFAVYQAIKKYFQINNINPQINDFYDTYYNGKPDFYFSFDKKTDKDDIFLFINDEKINVSLKYNDTTTLIFPVLSRPLANNNYKVYFTIRQKYNDKIFYTRPIIKKFIIKKPPINFKVTKFSRAESTPISTILLDEDNYPVPVEEKLEIFIDSKKIDYKKINKNIIYMYPEKSMENFEVKILYNNIELAQKINLQKNNNYVLQFFNTLTKEPIEFKNFKINNKEFSSVLDGFVFINDINKNDFQININGYNSAKITNLKLNEIKKIYLSPIDNGVLIDKKIMLDPDLGGELNGYENKKIKSDDINLILCKKLKEKLEKAGAIVYLTREDDIYLSDLERLQLSKKYKPNIFITISSASDNSKYKNTILYKEDKFLGHYFNSKNGIKLCNSISEKFSRIFHKNIKIKEYNSFLTIQTSMPAAFSRLVDLNNPFDRKKITNEKFMNKIIDSFYNGIVLYFSD